MTVRSKSFRLVGLPHRLRAVTSRGAPLSIAPLQIIRGPGLAPGAVQQTDLSEPIHGNTKAGGSMPPAFVCLPNEDQSLERS